MELEGADKLKKWFFKSIIAALSIIYMITFTGLNVKAITNANVLQDTDATVEVTLEEMKDINDTVPSMENSLQEINQYSPKVTVIYSINNNIEECYYKPKLVELPNLESLILKEGFVSVYTGFYDLNATDPNRLSSNEAFKPNEMQSRALEVLGYDCLLDSENYNGSTYSVVETGEYVTYGTALMDIYKALGLSQIHAKVYLSEDNSLSMTNSPVILNLPSIVKDIDTSKGRADVFVTRTEKGYYYEKAKKDLNIIKGNMDTYITNGEFIVLLTNMMQYYGEPVLSETEMNLLLQVYGAEVPTYLSSKEQEAYLYLKSRGVLNIDMDYVKVLKLTDMLNILMCVADEGSRTDYKQIQITMDVGDELVSKGYFPRQVNIAVGEQALDFIEEYNYSSATYYDYYIKIDNKTEFITTDGSTVSEIFIPNIPTEPNSGNLIGTSYQGIKSLGGEKYYHLKVPIMESDSDYMKKSKEKGKENCIQINSRNELDYPEYIWVEQGGGVYVYEEEDGGGIVTNRRPFEKDEFEDSVSVERKQIKENVSLNSKWSLLLDKIKNTFFTETYIAYADSFESLENGYISGVGNVLVTITITNAENITGYDNNIPELSIVDKEGVWEVTLPSIFKNYFLASITRDASNKSVKAYQAISSITGDRILLKYDDLVKAGVFYNEEASILPKPENEEGSILILNSKYGQVKLNNNTHEVVVGNTLYRVKNSKTVLFKYIINNGKTELWVDFRAAYGWTNNIIKLKITGNGEAFTVDMHLLEEGSSSVIPINKVFVKAPLTFSTYKITEQIQVIPKGIISQTPEVIMTSTYSLANWILYQGYNNSNGTSEDYIFIFYPKYAFQDGEMPNDLAVMKDIVGYTISVDDSWVCRAIKLSPISDTTPGHFTYVEDFGYVYNIPKWEDFTMEKYLNGTYILPLSYSGNGNIYNSNVNYFEGYPYGSRPMDGTTIGVDIKGNKVNSTIKAEDTIMKAAPAGISSFYGGAKWKVYTANSPIVAASSLSSTNQNIYYYGTARCIVKTEETKIKAVVQYEQGGALNYIWEIPTDSKFYMVNTMAVDVNSINTYYYRWCMFDTVLARNLSDNIENIFEENIEIEIIDAKQKDIFNGFKDFSLKRLIEWIDYGSSYIIAFVFIIFPIFGIVCITVLTGLSLISDMKIVQLLSMKLIDPIKILTVGKRNIETFKFKDAFVSLMLGYTIFALILNGNLLRIIQWLLNSYSQLLDLIKYV